MQGRDYAESAEFIPGFYIQGGRNVAVLDKSTPETWLRCERGATVVEYAVILALFAIIVIGAIALTERKVGNSFDAVTNELANPPGS